MERYSIICERCEVQLSSSVVNPQPNDIPRCPICWMRLRRESVLEQCRKEGERIYIKKLSGLPKNAD